MPCPPPNLSIHCNFFSTIFRLEEKLFLSFVFFTLAQKKRLTFILEKPFFMLVNPVFVKTTFLCVCSLKTNPVFYNQNLFYIMHSMYYSPQPTGRWQLLLILRPFWGYFYIQIHKYIRYVCFFLISTISLKNRAIFSILTPFIMMSIHVLYLVVTFC